MKFLVVTTRIGVNTAAMSRTPVHLRRISRLAGRGKHLSRRPMEARECLGAKLAAKRINVLRVWRVIGAKRPHSRIFGIKQIGARRGDVAV